MKKIVLGVLLTGLVSLGYAQSSQTEFPAFNYLEIDWAPIKNDYLQKVGNESQSRRVMELERKVSGYDYRKSPFYDARSNRGEIVFRRKNDYVLATYDRSGNLLAASEEYSDVILPLTVRNSIYAGYPGWDIESDTYKVSYRRGKKAQKFYKVRLRRDHIKKDLKFQV